MVGKRERDTAVRLFRRKAAGVERLGTGQREPVGTAGDARLPDRPDLEP